MSFPASKTCRKCGLPMTGDNLAVYLRPDGYLNRRCKSCDRIRHHQYAADGRRRMRAIGCVPRRKPADILDKFFVFKSHHIRDHSRCDPEHIQTLCSECERIWNECVAANQVQEELWQIAV